jgi:DNA-binding transcriptional regulator YiaG
MNHIKNYRVEAKLTQQELSKRSGVPIQTLRDWEQGAKKPTNVYQIYKVASALGCTIEDLIVFD